MLEVQREVRNRERLQYRDEAGFDEMLKVQVAVLQLMIQDPNLNINEQVNKIAPSLGLNEAQKITVLSDLKGWQDPITLRHAVDSGYERLQKEWDILDARDRMPIS